jgi:hypothetical protein
VVACSRALASPGVDATRGTIRLETAEAVAEEHAALRPVATLVASGAEPAAVFGLVAEEAGGLLSARSSATIRFDGDVAHTVGRWQAGDAVSGFEVGTRVPLTVRIEIEDDGRGGADPHAGTGLRGLADRVEALGGRFAVADGSVGGTVVSAELPA